MRVLSLGVVGLILSAFLLVGNGALSVSGLSDSQKTISGLTELSTLKTSLAAVKAPDVQSPAWLKAQDAAAAAARQTPITRTVTYSVTTRGIVTANLAEFRDQAHATLNDARGWARLGVSFQEVASGGNFILVLAEANQLPSFSSGCTADYSCNVGQYVIINQDRWLGATPSWNNAGGSLRDYRHMVVNHETGHWLGHSHEYCSGPGQSAPVMQQQSIDLQGCAFNAWPLASEMWSTRLGIDIR